ncbi:MAG: efflux RND transporter periplasmic adaptor subunit [Paraglaciecola sp.]|uniref:efflux RND transporter periplasmic adaptor subunit n=1 Tax=Paraglaciecola sp. TaxID=1920173 RepID=UPI00273FABF6|nr:efflux RND transporter periplasmic adaptor subunit [Paraglaciecola sp.]MDP5030059.1 efflux RND transporter periplasmic adaptor subunit [Paraglaciecola sp.]MDP5131162.1 efflux RND transporter periplasmic adaptor subunit [Paraglaciecola sp.]
MIKDMKPTFCLTLLILFFSSFYVAAQQRGENIAANVIVSPLQFENDRERIQSVGTAEAIYSVVLFPAVADRVTEVLFSPGDKVEKDHVLLHLDDRRQRVALERAKITLEDARRTVTRLKESRAQGAVPQNELDDAITLFELSKVALQEAEVELEDRVVRAPFAGVVGFTDVEVGDRITIQTPITTLDNRAELFVNFTAPEIALPMLSGKPTLTLQPWLNTDAPVKAVISQIDSRINVDSRSFRVRALLNNRADNYRPGMSFRVELLLEGQRYASIPEIALMWDATGAYVWVAEQQQARRVDVAIKQRLAGRILVDGKLSEGQLLITEGIQRLREGQALSFSQTVN